MRVIFVVAVLAAVVAAGSPVSEVQLIQLTGNRVSGSFRVGFMGMTTAGIAADGDAAGAWQLNLIAVCCSVCVLVETAASDVVLCSLG